MPDKEETERVTMLWPVDVKAQVRERVGPRGLTDFAVDAVRAKLGQPVEDPELAESKELGDARFLVQRLADCIAMQGDYEDRESVLREIDLPPWVQTIGWPENLARAINPIEPVGQPVGQPATYREEVDALEPVVTMRDEVVDIPVDNPAPDSESAQVSEPVAVDTPVDNAVDEEGLIDHPYEPGHSGYACTRMVMKDGFGEDCGFPAARHVGHQEADLPADIPGVVPGVGDNVLKEAPKSHSNDLFKRLQAKAAEKGVDVSGIDLKPASQLQVEKPEHEFRIEEIERPEVKTLTAEEVGWDLKVEPEPEVREPHIESMDNHANHRPTGQDCTDACPVEGNAHNHSWNKFEDADGLYVGQPYFCACGATMDKERVYERDQVPVKPAAEPSAEVPVPLEVAPDGATPLLPREATTQPPAPSWQSRAEQMDVDF